MTKGQLQVNGDDFRMSNGSGDLDFYAGSSNLILPRMKIAGRSGDLDYFIIDNSNNINTALKIEGNSGFVGIGTDNPSSLLTLRGETTDGVGGTHQLYILEEASSSFAKIKFANRSLNDFDYWEIAANSTSTNEFQINFRDFGLVGQTPFYNIITIEGASQQVGINTTNPAHDLSVNGSGGKPGGGTWATFSDKRLKKDITDFTDGLTEVMQINPVTYRFNGKAGIKNSTKTYVGIIAQDLQKVAPYMIEQLTMEAGNDETFLSYDGSALVYLLVNAIQEQQVIIDEKVDRLEILESRLNHLEALVKEISSTQHANFVLSDNK